MERNLCKLLPFQNRIGQKNILACKNNGLAFFLETIV